MLEKIKANINPRDAINTAVSAVIESWMMLHFHEQTGDTATNRSGLIWTTPSILGTTGDTKWSTKFGYCTPNGTDNRIRDITEATRAFFDLSTLPVGGSMVVTFSRHCTSNVLAANSQLFSNSYDDTTNGGTGCYFENTTGNLYFQHREQGGVSATLSIAAATYLPVGQRNTLMFQIIPSSNIMKSYINGTYRSSVAIDGTKMAKGSAAAAHGTCIFATATGTPGSYLNAGASANNTGISDFGFFRLRTAMGDTEAVKKAQQFYYSPGDLPSDWFE